MMPYKNKKAYAQYLLERLRREAKQELAVMEVCGTHTVAIARSGLRDLLPKNIRLISGPGCPVCVTADIDLDLAIALGRQEGVILTTFGDMMRVPGTTSSLQEEKGKGADIRIVYSSTDALKIAHDNPNAEVVFLAIGFETTSPVVAATVAQAVDEGLKNFSLLSLHKLVPPVMRKLLDDPDVRIDAFLNPGHVCTILGNEPFRFIAEEYGRPCIAAGFEAVDILEALVMIVEQQIKGCPHVDIQYKRAVFPEGNPVARAFIDKYFVAAEAEWRGLGSFPASGLDLRKEYEHLDARKRFSLEVTPARRVKGCICGEILKGLKMPYDCPLFGKACTPQRPVGPCMVSSEGACAAYYRYGRKKVGVNN